MFWSKKPLDLPTAETALKGRPEALPTARLHHVSQNPLKGPYPPGFRTAIFALGCFWGAERAFWRTPGVWVTAVGYIGGPTPNPTYEEVCSGRTGHTEAVLVAYDPAVVSYAELVQMFFESHDPTQGMRQGNDVGTQYRSGIYTADPQEQAEARAVKAGYAAALAAKGFGPITTEIIDGGPFYFAEDYHQQYLSKNPGGYCGLGGTGVSCPIGTGVAAQ
ncbi:peptide-methionine (S)-S-oxide reductase MsrA [Azorhizobium doebereinerae]|uniref:peptide-methionine (S)-S-oxide reductase MsrA n=1 Tax=Azorhizobium doebereinerae TaxID=281091 RepID=UPI0003FB3DED|nr:peptide-methionine (S)-S-oxide reductase MsrA [Azorhizobium doebereinerae]